MSESCEMTSRSWAIFGVDSSFSAEIIETLRRLGHSVAVGVITGEPEWTINDVELLCEEGGIDERHLSLPVAVPWVTPSLRIDRTRRAQQAGFREFAAVVDPTAILASNARLGRGVYVNAGAVVGADVTIEDHATINRAASIGHHTTLAEFASIGPGAIVASKCAIGRAALIGAGATVGPGVVLGDGCTVALGAVVAREVQAGVTVAGNPARPVRKAG